MAWKDPELNRAKHAEYMRENRIFWKGLNRCIMCHKQDAYTLAGRARCAECAAKAREYNNARSAEHREESRACDRDRYAARKAAGLCVKCGKPAGGHSHCETCRAKDAARHRAKRGGDMRGVGGMCKICGHRPAMDGGKLCGSCYDMACANIAKGRKVQDRSQHPWRLDDKARFAGVTG